MQTTNTRKVRWLDDGTIGTATKEIEDGIWLGTWTVRTRNLVTGGMREDKGAVLGMHVVEVVS